MVTKEKAAHLTRLRMMIRLPSPTFGRPTTPNGDALRCAWLVHLEKAEEIASAVPTERLARWCEPMKGKGIVGPMGVKVVYPKNVGECRGVETNDYAPIMLSMNTSRLSSTSCGNAPC